jgi:hypothetical protein
MPPRYRSGIEGLRMDMSSVMSVLAMQAGNTQMQVATAIMKSNDNAEKSAVQTLLGGQNASSAANLAAGVGGNLDVSA